MARRGRSVALGPTRCQVLASQIATAPAPPHSAFSSARSPRFQLGLLRVKWLRGTIRVAPLAAVKGSIIQAT